ncbi:MAG: NAD(P)/FAD-dependent oxidoreductase [Oscillospiraceae bacterium]|nr:NAD(P)/FAD-dependent oxidoreductase [Oscillospiraceae bacterium]
MDIIKYKNLFAPLHLAGTLFRNRIFAAPTGHSSQSGSAFFYGRRAMGGAASVCTGELAVDAKYGRGLTTRPTIDEVRISLSKMTNVVSGYGAVPTAELFHAGMYANRDVKTPGMAYGPVACEIDGRIVEEMPEDIIEYTISKYAEAAMTAKKCGFGSILVHAGHGWLLQQFMSPLINTRNDKWGGRDIENRARLTVAVCDAIRKAIGPVIPIEVRISGSERYEGGYDIDEGIAFAKQLEGHADLIHVSAGNHEVSEVFTVTHPRMFLGDGPNVYLAAEIKKHVKTPVATVGALGEPDMLEDIIASGKADVVEMSRSLIADPDLPNKIRTGNVTAINMCLRCLSCFSHEVTVGEKYCAINPEMGRIGEAPLFEQKAKTKKKVCIAGGGIGGMQAALSCAEYGHEVILVEKSGALGGAVLCERNVPFKRKMGIYIDTQKTKLKQAGVEILLNTPFTPALADKLQPDVIIAAVGSHQARPYIDGIDGDNVFSAEHAFMHTKDIGNSVAILGAGLVGLELALYLSMLGKKASVIEITDKISDDGNFMHTEGLKIELKNHGVNLFFNTVAEKIDSQGVLCTGPEGTMNVAAETVIYATGRVPLQEVALALNYSAPEFYMLGDCVRPSDITAATAAAYETAKNISR